ncbi:MAG: ABC transporter ATP-binding protein [Myxococcota bacterium]
MIELEHVFRTYVLGGEPIHALYDVSERIDAGDYVAVMGPSGSGKSTMLNILGCLDRPSQGIYRLDGQEVGSLSEEELSQIRRHKIGFVFQTFHLVPRLDAAENVAFPMVFAGVPRPERQARVEEALKAVGLRERAQHRPAELSGGERQRVAIARATVMRPRLLLADEPTGNLDSAAGRQVLELLERMHGEGLTLIVVTHDPSVAGRARRVLRMRDGRITARLSGRELQTPAPIPQAVEPEA